MKSEIIGFFLQISNSQAFWGVHKGLFYECIEHSTATVDSSGTVITAEIHWHFVSLHFADTCLTCLPPFRIFLVLD